MTKISIEEFNNLNEAEAKAILFNCCSSLTWANKVVSHRPFLNENQLFILAQDIWYNHCDQKDQIEAYSHHPRIGDSDNLRAKYGETAEWAIDEQSGTAQASDHTISELIKNNNLYFEKYGFVFLVCATGKSASEMSDLLSQRLKHTLDEEQAIAQGEQFKIALLRLQKVISLNIDNWNQVSQITTHVLDTSIGKPGKNIPIRLKRKSEDNFLTISMGITNDDGRVVNLLPPGLRLSPGHYQMCFDTNIYFTAHNIKGFYPKVDIDFTIFDESHYHVPLLINPYGYSTYRGS